MFINFLFNREEGKKNINATKRDAIGAIKEVEAANKKSISAIQSVMSGTAEQRKFRNRLKGDTFSQYVAASDSNSRQMLNKMLADKFLRPSDFKGGGKKTILDDLKSGVLKQRYTEFLQIAADSAKGQSEETVQVEKKNSAYQRLVDKLKKVTSIGANHNQIISKSTIGTGMLMRNLRTLAYQYASIYAVQRLINNVFQSSIQRERDAFSMSVLFGSKGNATKAMDFAEKKIREGAAFRRNDLVDGFRQMMEAGLDPTKAKTFDIVGNIAGATGKEFKEVASDLVAAIYGDSGALRKYGFTNKQVFALDRMVNQRPDNRRDVIMSILNKDGRYKDGMRDFSMSWDGLVNRMSSVWTEFKDGVMGKAEDSNSLYGKIKHGFKLIIDWFGRNRERIMRLAYAVQVVFKWIGRQVLEFGRYLARKISGVLGLVDGSAESFQNKMQKMVLWLELTKQRVIKFFETWGWAIKLIVKIWVASKIVSIVNSIVSPFATLLTYIKSIIGLLPKMTTLLGGAAAAGNGVGAAGAGAAAAGNGVGAAGAGAAAAGGSFSAGKYVGTGLASMGITSSAALLAALGGVAVVAGAIWMIQDQLNHKPPPLNVQREMDAKSQKVFSGGGIDSNKAAFEDRIKRENAEKKRLELENMRKDRDIKESTILRLRAANPSLTYMQASEKVMRGDTLGLAPVTINNLNVTSTAPNGKKLLEDVVKAANEQRRNN